MKNLSGKEIKEYENRLDVISKRKSQASDIDEFMEIDADAAIVLHDALEKMGYLSIAEKYNRIVRRWLCIESEIKK